MKNIIWFIIVIFLTGCLQEEKDNGGNDIFWDLSEKKDLHYSLSSITNIEKKSIIISSRIFGL